MSHFLEMAIASFREIRYVLSIIDRAGIDLGWHTALPPYTSLPKQLIWSSLEALLQDIWLPVVQVQYHLPKEAVCP
jgi:hypothetical protein